MYSMALPAEWSHPTDSHASTAPSAKAQMLPLCGKQPRWKKIHSVVWHQDKTNRTKLPIWKKCNGENGIARVQRYTSQNSIRIFQKVNKIRNHNHQNPSSSKKSPKSDFKITKINDFPKSHQNPISKSPKSVIFKKFWKSCSKSIKSTIVQKIHQDNIRIHKNPYFSKKFPKCYSKSQKPESSIESQKS